MKVARVSDIAVGTCFAHISPRGVVGTIVTGSPLSSADGLPVARTNDIVAFNCGHVGIIATGAGMSDADGNKIARVTDLVTGTMIANIITGSGMSDAN